MIIDLNKTFGILFYMYFFSRKLFCVFKNLITIDVLYYISFGCTTSG